MKLSSNDQYIYRSEIVPPFGFEPDAAYLCGVDPQDFGYGIDFVLKKRYRNKYTYSRLLNLLPEHPLLRKVLRQGYKLLGKGINGIPWKLIPFFEKAVPENVFDKNTICNTPSIFNLLSAKGKNYNYLGVPFSSGRLSNIQKSIKNDNLLNSEILFLYISDLDSIGHEYGITSSEYQKTFELINNFVTDIISYDNSELIVFGDHGMVDVDNYLDLNSTISQLPLSVPKDFLYFLDSTMARFWFFNEHARELIKEKFTSIPGGKWISEKEKEEGKFNYSNNIFGDEIWWVNKGNTIYPDFWQGNRAPKGMHGYRSNVKDNHTALVLRTNDIYDIKPTMELKDTYNILRKFLEI